MLRIEKDASTRRIRILGPELRGQQTAIELLGQLQACHSAEQFHCELDFEKVRWFCRHALDALITFMDAVILHSGVVVLRGLKTGPGWDALQRRQQHLAALTEAANAQ